ncbi:MAG TPA: hydroxymethylbilane synthase [Chloroflexota bacterium]|jgi:hydroxymethylbilane synthase|nr:hydroxymethylbilane synthase [Chloroflexota bacterium]
MGRSVVHPVDVQGAAGATAATGRPVPETVIGTRGSRLALAQTQAVMEAMRRAHPGLAVRLQVVSTEGDRVRSGPLPTWGQGVFVRDIERALLEGEIDLAVHSLKDVTADIPSGLAILAVPERADPGDVLVTAEGLTLDELPAGARVGTSSLRRGAFLKAYRPDLEVVPLRGNVDTRFRKLLDREQGLTAIVLAAAGLERLGLSDAPRVALGRDVLLPAPGQGALAIEGRAGDEYHRRLAGAVDDAPSHAAVVAERQVLRELEAGCRLPVAALAAAQPGGRLWLDAAVAAPDGSRVLRASGGGSVDEAASLGKAVAQDLLARGAADLLVDGRGREVGDVSVVAGA